MWENFHSLTRVTSYVSHRELCSFKLGTYVLAIGGRMPGFLITFVHELSMHVWLCVCMCPSLRLLITNGMIYGPSLRQLVFTHIINIQCPPQASLYQKHSVLLLMYSCLKRLLNWKQWLTQHQFTLTRLFSMIDFNSKATPTNNSDYSCLLKLQNLFN